jgi:hypothetical protein
VYDTLQLHYEQGELAEFAISKRADPAGGNMQDKVLLKPGVFAATATSTHGHRVSTL